AGIVSGLDRWRVGLRAHAEAERQAAASETTADRAERRRRGADDADAPLEVGEDLAEALDGLSGEASWPERSPRLKAVLDASVWPERDREAVAEVLADLAALSSVSPRAPWREVEQVLESRFEWERLPVEPLTTGGIHVGALDAIAGLPFRVVAVLGLVEGGYPGVLRPDPFLLDDEREALAAETKPAGRLKPAARAPLSPFDDQPRPHAPTPHSPPPPLP